MLLWFHNKIEASFEQSLNNPPLQEQWWKEGRVTHRKMVPAPRRLVYATLLASAMFAALFTIEISLIIFMHTHDSNLVYGMLVILSWIGGTYFGAKS